MKTRLLSLFLVVVLLVCTVGIGIAEGYDKHVSYTGSGWMLNTNADYNDAFYKFFSEKFNMDFVPYYTDRATNDEKVSLLVNTSSMPDGLIGLTFNYDAYLEWVDQGLVAPLPDGWEETYPDMYRMMKNTHILDKLTVDGKVYAIPHAVWHNFVQMDTPVDHISVFYRKDWAEQLGMSNLFEGDIVKKSDLLAFTKACVDANLGDNGTTIGLTCAKLSHIVDVFATELPYGLTAFEKTENGYQWAPCMDGVVDLIKEMRKAYQDGALDLDFYLANGLASFTSGSAAAMYNGCTANASEYAEDFVNAHANLSEELATLQAEDPSKTYYDTSVWDYIGLAVLAADDGVVHAIETTNFWSYAIFNPEIDPEVFARMLDLINWSCTPEGEVSVKIGIPGVDWKWVEEGKVIEQIPNADGQYNVYSSIDMLTQYSCCSDEMALVKKTNAPQVIEFVKKMYDIRNAGVIRPLDYDYKFFASEAKSQYSVDVLAKIVNLVVDTTLDIDTEWAKFIEENASMVNPVIADLNAVFYPAK